MTVLRWNSCTYDGTKVRFRFQLNSFFFFWRECYQIWPENFKQLIMISLCTPGGGKEHNLIEDNLSQGNGM